MSKKENLTHFPNKIGLFVNENDEVILNFPYKDCVLEAGMTKEDSKREKEYFLHNDRDATDIATLFAPKNFTNFKKNDKNGEKPLTENDEMEFWDEAGDLKQNLLVKWNNLVALHSFATRLAGKVKLIYIDPPYNTRSSSDTFLYNDSFKRSSWLVFMKNRLEIAKELLSDDGIIFISIDDNEFSYLMVLMNEIFWEENLIETFHFQVRYANKSLNEKNDFQPLIEYGIIFAKNKEKIMVNKPFEDYSIDKFIWKIKEKSSGEQIELWWKKVIIFKESEYEISKLDIPNIDWLKDTWASGSVLSWNTSWKFFDLFLSKRKDVDGLKVLYKVYWIWEDGLWYRYFTWPKKGDSIRGQFYSWIPLEKREWLENWTSKKFSPIVNFFKFEDVENFYDISGDVGNIRHEWWVAFNKGKKPEKMLQMILDYFTNPWDLVLDYHLGSGTTAAVAHKMGRRWIGIEQMDYIDTIAKERLKKVIDGEQGGISKSVNWQGGGDFVYFELKTFNADFAREIENATTKTRLNEIYQDMKRSAFLKFFFNPDEFEKEETDEGKRYSQLSLEEQKEKLIAILDMNHIYLNLENNNAIHDVSETDKFLTRKFYGKDE